jgi:alanine racemase
MSGCFPPSRENKGMRTWAEISLERLAQNYRNIQTKVGKTVLVAGVVKANAYGHGAVPVSRALVEEGAEWLAVSNVAEGLELRRAGIAARIMVMGGVLPFQRQALLDAHLTPVVHSLEELREWDAVGRILSAHLKVDTGMARLGMREAPAAILAAVAALKHVHVEGLLSHFATPEDPVQSAAQMERFEAVLRVVKPEVIHFASSFAISDRLKGSWLTMVRPGIALYERVLTWKAAILAVKNLPKGEPVGYGARYRAERDIRTAVIAAGYADGVPRALTNKGSIAIGDCLAPIIGAVSMDLTTIDVTDCAPVHIGDEAVIIGGAITADDVAQMAGTISYEILTGIGNRVERVYISPS